MTNLCAIAYTLAARTLRVTRLHFIENDFMLALLVILARQMA